ncbi:MAG: glycoside hydrolase family 18 protein [Saprospiraceae bacterium]|nr:glycoside hydrolase family 18 protein [Saprospiraceae bacterium]
MDALADNINFLINKYQKAEFKNFSINEIQMDCDWTLKSKENYFYFLQKLKSISDKEISATLRLYPYKYTDNMGVPPVDKVMLMCYNLLNPLENLSKNSILDLEELKSYLINVQPYPKHVDIALPIYSWAQVYHNEIFSAILYTDNKQLMPIIKEEKPLWYSVTQDKVIDDTYLRIGDKIKYENIDAAKIKEAIVLLKKYIHFNKNTTVTLFHLDEDQFNKFTNEELTTFYTDFTK